MKNLASAILKSVNLKKPRKNVYGQFEDLKQSYKFDETELAIIGLATEYQQAKIKYLHTNVFVFPFKKGDPRIVSKKLWNHFTLMYNTLKDNNINAKNYFEYIFKKLKNKNTDSLAVWFIYAEQYINSYLCFINKVSPENIEDKKSPEVVNRICDNIVKESLARRHCTIEEFWKELWINNVYYKFPEVYLKQNPYYRKYYAEGVYSKFPKFVNPFK